MSENYDLSDQAVDAAKQLAPWKTSIPWWVVLIEGVVVGGIGLMVVLDPQGANVNLALVLSAGLAIAGLLQFWDILQESVPEKIDSAVAARAGIAVYAGILLLVLYFIGDDASTGEQALTRVAGFGIFGTATLIYGLLALVQVFGTGGNQRRQAILEFLLFTSVGLVALYGLFAGGTAIITAVRIIGWIFLIAGIALIILSIWRQQKGDEADEMIDAATGAVGGAADAVTSLGRSQPADGIDKADGDSPKAEK
ncbi:MAG: hypothetical protein U9R25_10845 [Chloroflexota bacterium]|nr:hypothetical protein [Chloroflexota bacterium]